MKKYFYFIAATFLAAMGSCSEDFTQEPLPEGGIAVKATIENIDSRAAISGTKITWSAGDEIAILLDNNKYARLTLKSTDAGKSAGSFAGVIIGDNVAIATDAHAYYPYDINSDAEHVNLPASREVGDDLTNSFAYMKAAVAGNTLSFTHLGGVVKLILKKVPANSAQLVYTTLDNKNITGEFALTTVDGATQISASAGTGKNSSYTLVFNALSTASDLTVFLPMPVGNYEGVKLEIKDENGYNTVEPVTFPDATVNVSRANLLSMPTLTFVEFSTGDDAWDGTTYTKVTPTSQSIDGKTYNVYKVTKPAEFAWTAQNVATDDPSVYVKLESNMDLGEKDFVPFGNISRKNNSGFAGVIDGNGKTITGLKASATDDDYGVGLVAVAKGATIKNVILDGAELSSSKDFAGGVVGCSLGEVTISNCTVKNSVIESGDKCGGIVGRSYGATKITDCTVDASTEVKGGTNAGGITGIINANTTITGCTNNAAIEVAGAGSAGFGGIVGYLNGGNTTVIENCVNNGTVASSTSKYSGGICGYVNSDPTSFTIKNCTNNGDVYGNNAGGIFGTTGSYGHITVTSCNNYGTIIGVEYAGGIAAASGGGSDKWSCFTDCKNFGSVTAQLAGGVFGKMQYVEVKNCSGGGSSAVITGSLYKGRIVADVANGPYANNAILNIDDSNGDDYTNIGTIGVIPRYTSWGTLKVAVGTLHGTPYCGGNTGVITIAEGANWTAFPGQTGQWNGTANTNTWVKQ